MQGLNVRRILASFASPWPSEGEPTRCYAQFAVKKSLETRNFEKLTRRAGYPRLRLHDLRHAHAAGLIRVNTHPLVVAQRLGHSDPGFTMRVYGHVSEGLQRDAAKEFEDLMAQAGG